MYEKPSKKAEVFLDPGYMKEVFRNIFCNAMEAMEESLGEKKVFVELKVYDEEVEIIIKDTGPGLSENISNRLFNPGCPSAEGSLSATEEELRQKMGNWEQSSIFICL